MKKKFFLPVLIAGGFFAACNNDGATSKSTTDSTVTTATDNTKMSDTGMKTNTSTSPTNATPLEGMDKEFAMKAAMGGKMEVDLGNMAQSNAMSDRVKAFGAMMVRDHSQANNELMQLTKSKNTMIMDSTDKKMQDHMAMMQKMKGKDFDRHYMEMMLNDHKKVVAEFEKAASTCSDADLKAWAAKTLPVIKMHLDSAQAITKMKK